MQKGIALPRFLAGGRRRRHSGRRACRGPGLSLQPYDSTKGHCNPGVGQAAEGGFQKHQGLISPGARGDHSAKSVLGN